MTTTISPTQTSIIPPSEFAKFDPSEQMTRLFNQIEVCHVVLTAELFPQVPTIQPLTTTQLTYPIYLKHPLVNRCPPSPPKKPKLLNNNGLHKIKYFWNNMFSKQFRQQKTQFDASVRDWERTSYLHVLEFNRLSAESYNLKALDHFYNSDYPKMLMTSKEALQHNPQNNLSQLIHIIAKSYIDGIDNSLETTNRMVAALASLQLSMKPTTQVRSIDFTSTLLLSANLLQDITSLKAKEQLPNDEKYEQVLANSLYISRLCVNHLASIFEENIELIAKHNKWSQFEYIPSCKDPLFGLSTKSNEFVSALFSELFQPIEIESPKDQWIYLENILKLYTIFSIRSIIYQVCKNPKHTTENQT